MQSLIEQIEKDLVNLAYFEFEIFKHADTFNHGIRDDIYSICNGKNLINSNKERIDWAASKGKARKPGSYL